MYTFEKKDKQGILHIKTNKEEWEKAVNQSYERNKDKYNVQGFRRGKAPRRVIEQNYGDTVFFDDAFDIIVSEEYSKFLAENMNIVPAGHPHVEMNKFTVEEGLEATIKFDLMPEFNLPDLSTLNVKRGEAKVEEADIEKEIASSLEAHARYVEEDKVAENGDFATIDFEGYVDGEKFDGGSAEDYRLELGSHTFIEGFEEGVLGLKKDQEKDVNVVFPKDYGAENLAGKPATFKVKLKKIEKKVVPELNDKFVSDTTEFENIEDYKAHIKENLLKQATEKVERDYEMALIDTLAEKCGIELADSMVDHEVEHIVEDFEHRLSHQGMNLETYLNYLGKTLDEFKQERREDAAKNIKTRLALQKLISENKISISPEEIDKQIAEYADKYQMNIDEFKKNLSENDYAFFENNAIMTKVLDFLKIKNENK